ncbi:MAG TPA: S4 domain-containing protein [Candidatus Synoicihabitans sp.]|nr:S4 domain-containing protein [Candidatus Synoicihabitans sp.]
MVDRADDLTPRLDRWLWTVRVFKTRSLATAACRAGSVAVAGVVAKPAREIRAGDRVTVQQGLIERTLVVRGYPPNRVGARLVPEFCDDQTPPEMYARAKESPVAQFLARERGSGRPTKRDRRDLDRVFRS